jgi:hypothetical protein
VRAVHVPVVIALAVLPLPLALASHGIVRWLLVAAHCYFVGFWFFVWPWITRPFDNAAQAEQHNRTLLS